jgi:hypothetical protein
MTYEGGMLNLTPHAIVIQGDDGTSVTIPPSGVVARVATTETTVSVVGVGNTTVPVVARAFGQVTGLPETDEACIVSGLVLEAVRLQQPWRRRVYAPDTGATAIRDEAGRIIAVRRLVGLAP